MNKVTIYVVRHGKTLLNALDRVQGWCDSPLTDEGRLTAKHLGLGLKEIEFHGAYCSDLRRTLETAQLILESKGQADLIITEDKQLREACFGSFEASLNDDLWDAVTLAMNYANTDELDADLAMRKITYADIQNTIAKLDPMHLAETWNAIEQRTQEKLFEIAQKEFIKIGHEKENRNILLVAHGQCIAAMLLSLGGDALLHGDITNTSVSKAVYQNGQITVVSMADKSYQENGEKKAKNHSKEG